MSNAIVAIITFLISAAISIPIGMTIRKKVAESKIHQHPNHNLSEIISTAICTSVINIRCFFQKINSNSYKFEIFLQMIVFYFLFSRINTFSLTTEKYHISLHSFPSFFSSHKRLAWTRRLQASSFFFVYVAQIIELLL